MNSVQKEMIRLYAKQLRLPTFNNYEKVIRQLSADDGYAQFLIELMKQELAERWQDLKTSVKAPYSSSLPVIS